MKPAGATGTKQGTQRVVRTAVQNLTFEQLTPQPVVPPVNVSSRSIDASDRNSIKPNNNGITSRLNSSRVISKQSLSARGEREPIRANSRNGVHAPSRSHDSLEGVSAMNTAADFKTSTDSVDTVMKGLESGQFVTLGQMFPNYVDLNNNRLDILEEDLGLNWSTIERQIRSINEDTSQLKQRRDALEHGKPMIKPDSEIEKIEMQISKLRKRRERLEYYRKIILNGLRNWKEYQEAREEFLRQRSDTMVKNPDMSDEQMQIEIRRFDDEYRLWFKRTKEAQELKNNPKLAAAINNVNEEETARNLIEKKMQTGSPKKMFDPEFARKKLTEELVYWKRRWGSPGILSDLDLVRKSSSATANFVDDDDVEITIINDLDDDEDDGFFLTSPQQGDPESESSDEDEESLFAAPKEFVQARMQQQEPSSPPSSLLSKRLSGDVPNIQLDVPTGLSPQLEQAPSPGGADFSVGLRLMSSKNLNVRASTRYSPSPTPALAIDPSPPTTSRDLDNSLRSPRQRLYSGSGSRPSLRQFGAITPNAETQGEDDDIYTTSEHQHQINQCISATLDEARKSSLFRRGSEFMSHSSTTNLKSNIDWEKEVAKTTNNSVVDPDDDCVTIDASNETREVDNNNDSSSSRNNNDNNNNNAANGYEIDYERLKEMTKDQDLKNRMQVMRLIAHLKTQVDFAKARSSNERPTTDTEDDDAGSPSPEKVDQTYARKLKENVHLVSDVMRKHPSRMLPGDDCSPLPRQRATTPDIHPVSPISRPDTPTSPPPATPGTPIIEFSDDNVDGVRTMASTPDLIPRGDDETRPSSKSEKKSNNKLRHLFVELDQVLGKGGSSKVYRGIITDTCEHVAVKKISCKGAKSKKFLKLEIDMWRQLSHENVVKYIGCKYSVRRKEYNIVLEYIDGGSLADVGKLPERKISRLLTHIISGLAYLHKMNIIHRDLKPANMLVTKSGIVKISDFGVSTQILNLETMRRSCVGTPHYCSPEVILVEPYSFKCDIWSLGCSVYELLTGTRPYHTLNGVAAMFRMVEDEHPPFPDPNEFYMSTECKDFLTQCWKRNWRERPSAQELLSHPFVHPVVEPVVLF